MAATGVYRGTVSSAYLVDSLLQPVGHIVTPAHMFVGITLLACEAFSCVVVGCNLGEADIAARSLLSHDSG
jgi:hypothetical protein